MTVYVGHSEVEIVGGCTDEAWAAIQFVDEDEDKVRDVDLIQLGADEPDEEIYGAIEDRGILMGRDFDEHLPLEVRISDSKVTVVTKKHTRLYDENLAEHADTKGSWDVMDVALEGIRAVNDAHQYPKRLLFRNRDKLQ